MDAPQKVWLDARFVDPVILSRPLAIPTNAFRTTSEHFQPLKNGPRDANLSEDEVARNGAHLRITSARGFLGRPLAFQALPLLRQRHSLQNIHACSTQ